MGRKDRVHVGIGGREEELEREDTVLHADETPVAVLKSKRLRDRKTHKTYIGSYWITGANPMKAVVL